MTPTMRHLVIRADGGGKIGMGHIVRCSALAQAWCDRGGTVTMATAAQLGDMATRVTRDGIALSVLDDVEPGSTEDAQATLQVVEKTGARQLVMDGYRFGPAFQQAVKLPGVASVCIDDYGQADEYCADLVVNQNLDSALDMYPSRRDSTRFLLGTEFAMLRRDFARSRGRKPCVRGEARRVLVTMGAADPDNVTELAIRGLASLESAVQCAVVVGGASVRRAEVVDAARRAGPQMRVFWDAPSLRRLMQWADVIVCAGGTTSWEAAFIGLPMVTIILAENQVLIAEALARHEVSINLGWHRSLNAAEVADAVLTLLRDEDRRRQMANRSVALVDGRGASRVAAAIESLPGHH